MLVLSNKLFLKVCACRFSYSRLECNSMGRRESRRGPLPPDAFMRMADLVAVSGRPVVEKYNTSSTDNGTYKPKDNRSLIQFSDRGMNVSAWSDFNKTQQPVLDGLSFIHSQMQPDADSPNGDIPVGYVFLTSAVGSFLPLYLTTRIDNPLANDRIPDSVAHISKASQGIMIVADAIAKRDGIMTPVSPEMLYEEANDMQLGVPAVLLPGQAKPAEKRKKPLLVGATDVCPAPKARIIQALGAMMYGHPGSPENSDLGVLFDQGDFSVAADFTVKVEKWGRDVEKAKRRAEAAEAALSNGHVSGLRSSVADEAIMASLQSKYDAYDVVSQAMADDLNAVLGRA